MSKSTHTVLVLAVLVGAVIGWACNQSAQVDDSWAQDSCSSYNISILEIDDDEAGIQQSTNMTPVGIAETGSGYAILLRNCKN
jgi:hypothetical protein